ncbi:MAG: hypothetical protein ABW215_09800 [Kibdelosporangium sp.]
MTGGRSARLQIFVLACVATLPVVATHIDTGRAAAIAAGGVEHAEQVTPAMYATQWLAGGGQLTLSELQSQLAELDAGHATGDDGRAMQAVGRIVTAAGNAHTAGPPPDEEAREHWARALRGAVLTTRHFTVFRSTQDPEAETMFRQAIVDCQRDVVETFARIEVVRR